MIKELKTISDSELESLINTTISITEKIDAPYVNVILNESSLIILKSNYKIITNIDCILNSMYYDIKKYINDTIEPVREKIVKEHGSVIIGLFYLPSEKPRTITYYKLNNKFIYSTCKRAETNKRIIDFDLNKYCPTILPTPKVKDITLDENYINIFKKYKNSEISDLYLVNKLIAKTYSGNKIKDIEGLIFSIKNNKLYQIILNAPEEKLDVAEHKIYRDLVLKDFIDWYNNNQHGKNKDSYINIINELFIGYINTTDITDRYSIEPIDLNPPIISYFGDITYELINNEIITTICQHNELFKCIYRILLSTMRHDTLVLSKDTMLSEYDINNWKKIFKDIQLRLK